MHDESSLRSVQLRDGNWAKASYLLSVLSNAEAGADDQMVALLNLLADGDALAQACSAADIASLGKIVERSLGELKTDAAWSTTALPTEDLTDPASIEGVNVQCVLIGPASAAPVAVVQVPEGGRYVVATEYTTPVGVNATLQLIDKKNEAVVATHELDAGFNRLSAFDVELDAAIEIEIRLENSSAAEDLRWFSTRLSSAAQDSDGSKRLTQSLTTSLRAEQAGEPESVVAPITGEPVTLQDIDRLMSLQDAFKGERIFIMGNGPSLNKTPLEKLENDYVFGVNRISLLFERVSWRPTFFTAFDVRVVPDNKEEFAELDIEYKFFSARYKTMLGQRPNHYWYHTKGFYDGFEGCFDPSVVYSGFGGGGTIGVMAAELAFFMGFREIYLIGTDVSYSVKETVRQAGPDAFGDGVGLELESTDDDDANHFDPRYFGKGKKWHNPNVREMKIGFARAAQAIERRGGVLLNATVGGELNQVPRVDFDSLF